MALNYPDPAVTNPWYDGVQWWSFDGDGWLRIELHVGEDGIPPGNWSVVSRNADFNFSPNLSSNPQLNHVIADAVATPPPSLTIGDSYTFVATGGASLTFSMGGITVILPDGKALLPRGDGSVISLVALSQTEFLAYGDLADA